MEDIPFSQGGEHSLMLLVDEKQIAELTFGVNLVDAASSPEAVWAARLDEGVNAFSAGETQKAEEMFRAVIQHRPNSGTAHNNLAFVQLSQGKVVEARAEFMEAYALNFDRPELLDANIACCDYLLGDYAPALERFERCLKARPFMGSSVLFGIEEDGLFPVDLGSAADYLALMLLNAAWCAIRVSAAGKAREYAHRAAEFEIVKAATATAEPQPIARSLTIVHDKLAKRRKSG
jgi:Tfp pilus assembly protein PilF